MDGIVILNKEQGFTSMDCCAIIRKLCGERRVGHSGTLDPNATGVLPIFVGRATRLIEYTSGGTKAYTAGFRLGVSSDTDDIWGDLSEGEKPDITEAELLAAFKGFIGEIDQIPPMYSAKKVNGRRLYSLAREGIELERKASRVRIYDIRLISFDGSSGVFELECGRGCYVRSICAELGKKLGCGAVMSSLVRTESCGFHISEARTLDELREDFSLLPLEEAFRGVDKIEIDESRARLFLNGNPLWTADMPHELLKRNGDEAFIAVYSGAKLLGTVRGGRIDKVLR